jgi:hypothetical protein
MSTTAAAGNRSYAGRNRHLQWPLFQSIKQYPNSRFTIALTLLGHLCHVSDQPGAFANYSAPLGFDCLCHFEDNLITNFGATNIDIVLKLTGQARS